MKPIAMRCTQQDWEEIKPILKKNNIKLGKEAFEDICNTVSNFNYLVTNYNNVLGLVNLTYNENKGNYDRKVYKEWDTNIFLDACDIKLKFTIQDLKEGKCAVINDGTLDELNKLLGLVFPLSIYAKGVRKYYEKGFSKEHWACVDNTDLPTQSVKDFLKQEIKETNMDSRFPFNLAPMDAQKIINSACSTWKNKLASQWAVSIVTGLSITIFEEFYKEMRIACRADQHTLFDSIFGKDDIFKKNDLVVVTGTITYNYGLSSGSIKPRVGKTYKYLKYSNGLAVLEVDSLNKIAISNIDLRLATEEEVKAFNSYKYKDGELVFVRKATTWELRYTTGKINNNRLECYDLQEKTGETTFWSIYQPAPGIKLPD